jgi:hypothetical protein
MFFEHSNNVSDLFIVKTAIDRIWKREFVKEDWSDPYMRRWYLLISHIINIPDFEQRRADLFSQWFFTCLCAPLIKTCGEHGLLKWMEMKYGNVMRVFPTTLEHIHKYVERHGVNTPEPTVFIQVPFIEVGITTPIAYLDFPRWMWNKQLEDDRKWLRMHYSMNEFPEQIIWSCEYALKPQQRKQQQKKMRPPTEPIIGDIEDMGGVFNRVHDVSAPCIQQILKRSIAEKRFPPHLARKTLVITMKHGNLHEYIQPLLIFLLNPHEKKTWEDVKKYWNCDALFDKEYAPVKCDSILELCPFGTDNTGGKLCNQCFKQMTEKTPHVTPKPSDQHGFGPHKFPLFISRSLM